VLCIIAALAGSAATAQTVAVADGDTSIVQYLERHDTGGEVNIVQPAALTLRLSRTDATQAGQRSLTVYRVQLFSDNRSTTAKAEADRRAARVREIFTDVDVYVTFTSPFWRLRVGNFRSYEDANKILHELKTAFPDMASEMRIVRDRANVEMLDYIND
ncbi:MAG TPA: SPOR domain-containing protein, partial [Candidatus Barnesiella excrementipullorum]|nr:SPOR domain-containing protein [Candidatus Barnesiella excrementipullorum]